MTMKKDLSKKLASLSPEQRALLERKLREKNKAKKSNVIPVRENQSEYPMSFAQRGLWFLSQLNKESAFYNMPALIKISGKLNYEALESSINEVIKRHEILRSNYLFDGEPKQTIKNNLELKINRYEITELEGRNDEEKIEKFSDKEGTKPFDLTNDSLIRISLIKVNDTENVLIVTFHHIVADGWSLAVFVNEIVSSYTAFVNNEKPELPELKIQYADFAKWQQDKLNSNAYNSQIEYWKKQLKNLTGNLNLPLDKPRPKQQTFNGLHKSFQIDEELFIKAKEFSKKHQTTMFVVMLSLYKTLLYRYTLQEDITVGSPIAYRDKTELQNLIGFFINTLVFRTDFSSAPNFIELVQMVHKTTMDAFENKDVPFEKVVDALKVKRSQDQAPLFQTLFVMQNTPKNEIKIPGLTFKLKEVETHNVKFDLTLSIEETNKGLTGLFGYNTDLFKETTIDEFIKRFRILLNNILRNPEMPLNKVAMVSTKEKELLLKQWSITKSVKNLPLSLHSLFENQVKTLPTAIALEYPTIDSNNEIQTEYFTYSELDKKANIVANYLISKNVKPDSIVALSFNRSPEMMISILGILKSGAAYLPVDPNYPVERKQYMLQDAGAKLLLSDSKIIQTYNDFYIEKIELDEILKNYPLGFDKNPNINITSDNLAYIIYTSGSTGNPKGVAITHKSVVNYIVGTSELYGFKSNDRVLQFSSISFDAAAEEIYHTWYKGATLILRPDAIISSPKMFLDFSVKENITVWDMPTAYWHQLIQEIIDEDRSLPKNLHSLLIGGERIEPLKAKLWLSKFGDKVKFFNTYGPTETTIVSLFYQITQKDIPLFDFREVPIGKPVNGLTAYVLDEDFNPLPLNVPGELCIGGIGLAKEYLNKPEITEKSFISNPFDNIKVERIYKTGDKVRMLNSGDMEYLGRIDDQVKVRGFRIELKEINKLLNHYKDIKESVVLTKKDINGQNILFAYYVEKNDKKVTSYKLREYLKKKLPDYMIPASFIKVDSIPLTTNGKIDTKSLLAIDTNIHEKEKEYKPPRNELEVIIGKMWSEVLGIEKIGIDENFFELGGDSLKAAVFINKLQKNLVKLFGLFLYSTIKQ